mmetsp:Transcript_10460/g.27705  ORF Transcript_10460/g.27705 Transcript_10460/m.27705 type:complete len:658 (+) Transcript_10460:555-2528(+)
MPCAARRYSALPTFYTAPTQILVSRLIDRPLRPMIAEGWTHDTQLLSWVLSYDQKTVPNPLSVCGCAAALAVSDIPLVKPVAAVQLGMHPDTLDFIVNPTREEFAVSPLNMMLAGTAEGVLMIEGEGDFLTEAQMVAAVQAAHDAVKKICAAIGELAEKTGRPKVLNTLQVIPPELKEKLNAAVGDGVASMLKMTDPEAGGQDTFVARAEMKSLTAQAIDGFAEEYGTNVVKVAFKKLCSTKMREMVRDTGRRCDGRAVDEVRPISIDVGVLPHTHGSSVFTRGETQSLATVTLGDGSMNMKGENLDGQTAKRFYLQYSFPPCSVGEVGRTGAPGRREVGHGNLAERALVPGVPKENEFPYSMRVESLITESSGSSSMASVCGGSLALMDAGVPMSRVIAGVAMGLILDEDGGDDEPLVLTDILGIEDGLGTMDFKVAGDESGISTFQLDIKCEGLAVETLERALEQARQGRLHILEQMQAALPGPRTELPSTVPKMISLAVPVSSIGKVIGPGGKTIRAIIEDFELQGLDVGEEGAIAVSGFNVTKMEQAKAFIEKMTAEAAPKPSYDGPFPEEGRIFRKCEVVSVKNFGVFVSLGDEFPGLEGLVHVSELHTERIRNINGFVKEGQRIDVKCLGMADGKLKLSRKAVFETAAAGK